MYKKIALATLLLFSFSTLQADYTLKEGKRTKSRIDRMPKNVVADMKNMMPQVTSNLRKIDAVQGELRQQIQKQITGRLNLLEAKQRHMIERVDSVLEELERVLRQM